MKNYFTLDELLNDWLHQIIWPCVSADSPSTMGITKSNSPKTEKVNFINI